MCLVLYSVWPVLGKRIQNPVRWCVICSPLISLDLMLQFICCPNVFFVQWSKRLSASHLALKTLHRSGYTTILEFTRAFSLYPKSYHYICTIHNHVTDIYHVDCTGLLYRHCYNEVISAQFPYPITIQIVFNFYCHLFIPVFGPSTELL